MHLKLDRSSPTLVEHSALQVAFDHFNATLFEGQLPPVLMSLQRHRKSFGYYWPKRFTREGGERLPEIAMNPSFFGARSILGTLSTVVHEICHHAQYSRRNGKVLGGYHDKEFSELMLGVGLQTSNTGAPYGTPCGHSMTHYVVADGAFLRAANDLLERGFELVWVDCDSPHSAVETIIAPALEDLPKVARQDKRDLRVASAMLREPTEATSTQIDPLQLLEPDDRQEGDEDEDEDDSLRCITAGELTTVDRGEPSAPQALAVAALATANPTSTSSGEPGSTIELATGRGSVTITRVSKNPGHLTQQVARGIDRSNRVKYRCDGCRSQIWGKPGIDALCRPCNRPFEALTSTSTRSKGRDLSGS